MKKFYKIAIPNPCHEDWNAMTPAEKGRFCDSCAKTVIDFSKMSTMQIQDFIQENEHTKMCGHFKTTQLDTIHLTIPVSIIQRKHSATTYFLFALLLAMGTSLISCTNHEGNIKKIQQVQVIEDPSKDHCASELKTDKPKNKCNKSDIVAYSKEKTINNTLGFVAPKEEKKDTIPIMIEGEIDITVGMITPVRDSDLILYHDLDTFPAFNSSTNEKRTIEVFSNEIKAFVSKNFDTTIGKKMGLSGVYRIYSRFEIDKEGRIQDLKIRAPYPKLEEETNRVITSIPKLIPGTYNNQPVRTLYTLPIVFKIEE